VRRRRGCGDVVAQHDQATATSEATTTIVGAMTTPTLQALYKNGAGSDR
jgi:hypothetical protein